MVAWSCRCWEYPSSSHCRKGIIFKVFFCISSFLLPKVTSWHIFIRDGFLTDNLKPCNPSLCKDFFWTPSYHWWPLCWRSSPGLSPHSVTDYASGTGFSLIVLHSMNYCPILPLSAAHLFPLLRSMQV